MRTWIMSAVATVGLLLLIGGTVVASAGTAIPSPVPPA